MKLTELTTEQWQQVHTLRADWLAAGLSTGAVVLAALIALAEAGWVLVPGLVETEWSNTYTDTGERWPRPDEAAARECAADDYPAVAAEFRQVTAWQSAPEPTQDGDNT